MKEIKSGEDCTEYLRANSPMVYHYCDGNAFLNIIQSKKIWLSHSDYMNDYQECRLLDRIFFDSKEKCDHYFASKIIQVNEIYTRYFSNSINRYISSFSLIGDLLSQWRGYADNGTGFVFGFNSYDLTCHLQSILSGIGKNSYNYQFLFTPIINYDIDLWMKDNGLQRIIIDCISRHIDDPVSAAFNIKILSTQYKHPSFSEEQEYRIVYVIDTVHDYFQVASPYLVIALV